MKNRYAFTMIELIFVIVIMGILAKFGVEFLAQAYNNFILSKTNNALQYKSAFAVEAIASRLQYRIKDSVIAREASSTSYQALSSSTYGDAARVLEWVASDIDGFRGTPMPRDISPDAALSLPLWSGIIDLNASSPSLLKSPETNTTELSQQIEELSHESGTTIDDAAIYFVGSDSDIDGYGWDANPITTQNSAMHPIKAGGVDGFISGNNVDFSGVSVYEYYQLSWTAYAVVHSEDGDLTLHFDYQPWHGESFNSAKKALIMQNVTTFRFKAIGSTIKIQVCVKSDVVDGRKDEEGGYSLCKEKTIF